MSEKSSTWHNLPREAIDWYPTIESKLCMGCGICVLGCGSKVYMFDYQKKVPVVAQPMNCKVGCTTCENTCPQHAVSFPSMSYLHKLITNRSVISQSKKVLMLNAEKFAVNQGS